MRYTVESDIGKKRAVNEDRAIVIKRGEISLALVADGMGGHNAGDVASTMTVEGMKERFLQADIVELQHAKKWLSENVQQLNTEVYQYAITHEHCQGMGTTLIAVLINGDEASICHVGDSRVYFIEKTNIQLITRDHSYVNILVENGEISEEEAQTHPNKNYIVKSLGTEKTIAPDFYNVRLKPATYLLVCSDGLSNKVDAEELHKVVIMDTSLAQKGSTLINLANEYGGEDNITLILMQLAEVEV